MTPNERRLWRVLRNLRSIAHARYWVACEDHKDATDDDCLFCFAENAVEKAFDKADDEAFDVLLELEGNSLK